MSGFVGGCAPTSSERQFPIPYTVGSLFREAVSLEEMCYRRRPSPLQGGKASLLLRKGSETLYFVRCQNKRVAGLVGA